MSKAARTSNDSNKGRSKKTSNMRVAIAGTGGIARWIAHCIHQDTGHQLLWLSRSPKPSLTQGGYQVMVVNYESRKSLEFALKGVDVVISTIPGSTQIRIIDAAIKSGVKRFAPAEFEGRPSMRSEENLINRSLDRGKSSVLMHLHRHREQIEYTVFVCGILYERFAPGGLQRNGIGGSTGISHEANFMIDVRNMRAHVPYVNSKSQPVEVCLTATSDLARFITKALDIQQKWPPELIMHGERIKAQDLLGSVVRARGRNFPDSNVIWHDAQSLRNHLANFSFNDDNEEARQIRELIATQEGRYSYDRSNLNNAFPDIQPTKFEDWLRRTWASGA